MREVEENEGLKEAQELLEQISLDEHEQELAFKRELYEMDKKAIKAAGYYEGLEEGIQQGIKEGIQQGEKEKAIKIAKNLLKQNISIEIVVKCTGLTKEEIEKLK